MKNIQMRGDIVYFVRREGGKVKWTKLGNRRDERTWEKYASLISEPETTFLSVATAWYKHRTRPNHPKPLSANSRKIYSNKLKPTSKLMRFFGNADIKAIKRKDVQAYLDSHSSPVAANRDISLMSVVFNYALVREIADMNPCTLTEKNHETSRNYYMTDEEFRQMHDALPVGMGIAMDLLYLTGLRVSDVLKLKHSDIRDGYLHAYERKTKQAVRYPLSDSLRAVLSRSLTDIGYVVTGDDRKPISLNDAGKIWRATRERLELRPIQLRDIRAKHATDRDAAGLNAQMALGHTSPTMTKRYLRHEQGRIVELLETIE